MQKGGFFTSESTHQDSIPELVGVDFGIRVIMIDCVFIQINKLMLEGKKSICILEMICTTGTGFRYSNFGIKKGTIHSISPFNFQYRYTTRIFTNFLLVRMKGNISKEMAKKMKRRESLESEPSSSQATPKFDHEDKK